MLFSGQRGVVRNNVTVGIMGGKRAGRPWGAAKGSCQEINELVALMRSWLDAAGVPVTVLHERLTPDHFGDRCVPELHKLRDRLAGTDLAWELVEAVVDVCFPEDSVAASIARLAPAKQLWRAAQHTPTVPGNDPDLVQARELLEAKDRTIAAYQEIDRARQAYQASEHGRHQALQAATLVFALLGQAQAKIAELSRRIDALRVQRPSEGAGALGTLHHRLERAIGQEKELRQALARAEEERDMAQRVADHAARRIQALEEELSLLKSIGGGVSRAEEPADGPADAASSVEIPSADPADETMDDVDRVLDKVHAVLEHGHETVQEAAEEVGWTAAGAQAPGAAEEWRTVPGRVLRSSTGWVDPRTGGDEDDGAGLSPTTPDNPSARRDASARLALTQRSAGDRHRYVGAATRRISRGLDLDEIILGLCRSAVPTFADAIAVYLRDPIPVGDERPHGPLLMRLRRQEGWPVEPGEDGDGWRPLQPTVLGTSGTCAVRSGGPLSEVLRGCVRCSRRHRPRRTPSPSCWASRRNGPGCPPGGGRCWPRCAAGAG